MELKDCKIGLKVEIVKSNPALFPVGTIGVIKNVSDSSVMVATKEDHWFYFPDDIRPSRCPKCKGKGYYITHQKDKNTCELCKGTGKQ